MALEPITRQEKIIAGQDLTPITRLEKFLKNFGGSGGGGGEQPNLSQTDSTKPDYIKGVIRQDSLPEGYPYKEGSRTVIEWDGNTEGRPIFGNEVSGACKVSDEVFDNLAGCPITFIAGDEVVELTLSEGVKAMDNIYSYGDGANQNSVLVVLGENAQNLETGTYFFRGSMSGNIMYVSKLTVSTETIHPMAPEFLPAGVGGGYVMELNPGDYSQDSSGFIIDDVSYDPLYEAISQGQHAVIKLTMEQDGNTQTSFVAVIYSELRAGGLYCYARMNDFDMAFKFYNGSYHSA